MTKWELERWQVIQRVLRGELTQLSAGGALGLGERQVRRMVKKVRRRAARPLVPHREKARSAAPLKQIWLEPDRKSARRAAAALIADYGKRFPDAIRCLEEGLEDSLSFDDLPEVDKKRISSTNGREGLNTEIRRRSRMVGVFTSVESYIHLTICYLIEYAENWASERRYIREDKVLGSLDWLHELTAQAAN